MLIVNMLVRKIEPIFCLLMCISPLAFALDNGLDDALEKELLWLKAESVVSVLTPTTRRNSPTASTLINQEEISHSGARSLNELLERKVPGLQLIKHNFGTSHLGLRGIISDRDDKFLLLVNGRSMNQHTLVGAFTERDLPLLREIHHIDVIRGPGSATLGLGAVSMVINIVTYNSDTFEGLAGQTRGGLVENYVSQEVMYGHKFNQDTGIYAYFGISDYQGANNKEAPYKIERDFTSVWGDSVAANQAIPLPKNANDNAQYRGNRPYKFHLQFKSGELEAWFRATSGGEMLPLEFSMIATPQSGGRSKLFFDPNQPYQPWSVGYNQQTFLIKNAHTLGSDFKLDYSFSMDHTDYERHIAVFSAKPWVMSHQEHKYLSKAILTWQPEKSDHSVALGMEISREKFGLPSPGYPNNQPTASGYTGDMTPWWTTTYSGFFEHQWKISENWTSFIGGRVDKNTYTDLLFSPRFALIQNLTEHDTIKYMLSRSQRMNFAAELRNGWNKAKTQNSKPEKLDSAEIRWEHNKDKQKLAASVFYYDLSPIGWDNTQNRSVVVGSQKHWGFELESEFSFGDFKLIASHSYAKLLDFNLNPGRNTVITAAGKGVGNNLNNYSNHQSKLSADYQINSDLKLTSNFVYYWGFPGSKDYLSLNNITANKIDNANAYLDLSLIYSPIKQLSFGITGHYLLGLIDEDLNKRNYFETDTYRDQAPAISFTARYQY